MPYFEAKILESQPQPCLWKLNFLKKEFVNQTIIIQIRVRNLQKKENVAVIEVMHKRHLAMKNCLSEMNALRRIIHKMCVHL